jgi:predicted esterase
MTDHIHRDVPVLGAGSQLDDASVAMIMIHGRGSSANNILSLADEFGPTPGVAYLAPQANSNTWYPYSFLRPLNENEPALSSALRVMSGLIAEIEAVGIPSDKIFLLGFSQGACLATEFAARNARRYGGVFGLSGGLIGDETAPRDYSGSLAGTPVFLGCSDKDSHIPLARVQHTTQVMQRLGADVTERIYPNMGHTVNDDEITFIRSQLNEAINKA